VKETSQQIVITQPLLGQIREELRNEPPGMTTTPKLVRRLLSEALASKKAKRASQAERLESLTPSLTGVGK
jgi:hypothetical protein